MEKGKVIDFSVQGFSVFSWVYDFLVISPDVWNWKVNQLWLGFMNFILFYFLLEYLKFVWMDCLMCSICAYCSSKKLEIDSKVKWIYPTEVKISRNKNLVGEGGILLILETVYFRAYAFESLLMSNASCTFGMCALFGLFSPIVHIN